MVSSSAVDSKTLLQNRKQAIVSCLCKHLSVDPKFSIESVEGSDVKNLVTNVLEASGKKAPLDNNEVEKWFSFADNFSTNAEECTKSLQSLNEDLTLKSVLAGGGTQPSEADLVVFAAIHSFVIGLSATDRKTYTHVLRWMDYIQNKEDLGKVLELIPVEVINVEIPRYVPQVESELSSKKGGQGPKTDDKSTIDSNSKKSDKSEAGSNTVNSNKSEAVTNTNTESTSKSEADSASKKSVVLKEKKKAPVKDVIEKETELSVSLLNIQVGLIRKAWKHPSADSLLVEEIELGDGVVRQVVSGLAKYCSPDDLTNRRVALITNVKPGKLRDVASSGLVLCASNADQTVVEPILPPEGAKIGERVSFSGHDGKPEDVLNPKKKQLEKITPNLRTDDKGVATFKGVAFMTSAGPCTSSIPNASIK
ncbi:hypothetical protein ACHQM5_013453 [Ranunculus cassubicifolius]